MTKICKYFLLLLSIIFLSFTSSTSQPKIKIIGKSSFSFGKIYQGSSPTHKIKITNIGNATLKIRNINSPCECSELSISSYSIEPKDSATLTVKFKSDGYNGLVKKYVSIASNDLSNSTVIIPFNVDVRTLLKVEPNILFIKNSEIESSKFPTINITNTSKRKIKIKKFYDPTNIIEVMLSTNMIKPGETVKAEISVHPVGETTRKGEIEIKTDNLSQPTLRVKYLIERAKKSES